MAKEQDTQLQIQHHGILGQRWGVRRFQNKDGSLTAAGRKKRGAEDDETDEQRRAKALKSTDAREIYRNRKLLSTSEINERLNRIDTEKRLASVAEGSKKSGFDRIDKALKIGRKINEVYEFTNTPVFKALKKKMNGEPVNKPFNLNEVWNKKNSMSDAEIQKAAKRITNERIIKKYMDEVNKNH